MEGKDLLSIADLTSDDAWRLIRLALELKRGGSRPLLAGQSLAMIFEKPSLRTKVSFDVAMYQLGGHAIYLAPQEIGLGQRESVPDAARVLSRLCQGIMARVFRQTTVEDLARFASVPVINGLSDDEHPCQALADFLTIFERKGGIAGVTVSYIGDGNNVANSLAYLAALLGAHFRIAAPAGYQMTEDRLRWAQEQAARTGGSVMTTTDPEAAAAGADVIYTDVWTSMGQEAETEARRVAFSRFQIDQRLLDMAKRDVIFLHPLPAHHGEEVAFGVIDDPRSAVFDEAENRLHAQKAVLAELMG